MKRWAQPREICAPCWDSVAGEGQGCWNLLNSSWNPPLLIRVSTLCLVTRALVQNLKSRTMKQTRSTHSFTVCLSFSQSIRYSAVSVSHWQSHKNCNWYSQRDQASPIRRPYHPVSTASQSRTVNKVDILAASPHRTLNTRKGVIKCAPLIDCDRDKTLKELEPQGINDIFNISVKDDSGGSRNTNTFLITFSTPTVPQHLTVGYLILDQFHGSSMHNVKTFLDYF